VTAREDRYDALFKVANGELEPEDVIGLARNGNTALKRIELRELLLAEPDATIRNVDTSLKWLGKETLSGNLKHVKVFWLFHPPRAAERRLALFTAMRAHHGPPPLRSVLDGFPPPEA
jgi:hypothetical protein